MSDTDYDSNYPEEDIEPTTYVVVGLEDGAQPYTTRTWIITFQPGELAGPRNALIKLGKKGKFHVFSQEEWDKAAFNAITGIKVERESR